MPMPPSTMRSLGATAPFRPRTAARTICGVVSKAPACRAVLRNRRRLRPTDGSEGAGFKLGEGSGDEVAIGFIVLLTRFQALTVQSDDCDRNYGRVSMKVFAGKCRNASSSLRASRHPAARESYRVWVNIVRQSRSERRTNELGHFRSSGVNIM